MAGRTQEPRLPAGLELAWGTAPAPMRGPKPAHSIERIIATASEIADAEGFAALSLPKIAGRLGFTTNALYRYVRSKEELVVVLRDAAFGEPPDAVWAATGWRAAASAWARAVVARYGVHPWLLDVPVRGAPTTPCVLRWLEALLQGMADSGLGGGDLLGCAGLLDGYAHSTAILARDLGARSAPAVESAAVARFLQPLLRERGFAMLDAIMATGAYATGPAEADFGLDRILDGIEVYISSRLPAHGEPSD